MTDRNIHAFLADFVHRPDPASSAVPGEAGLTRVAALDLDGCRINQYTNEFWTARQRQASSIHEISYRACFKPQLAAFFIRLLTDPGQTVYDPFSGRGTTVVEAALSGRRCLANDVNPLSTILTAPRLHPPDLGELALRLAEIPVDPAARADLDLSMFYHPATEAEICSLRSYLARRRIDGREDDLDRWIAMAATNRLTGHSTGFFSVYTLPPNQAVSPESQIKINRRRAQKPEYRDTRALILRKSKSLLRNLTAEQVRRLRDASRTAEFFTQDAAHTREIPADSVQLTVTSPPFLDIVQYSRDNWLRCWFNHVDAQTVSAAITMSKTVTEWSAAMTPVFDELYRITRPGGWVAFEVGEVRNRRINLEQYVLPLGRRAGFECRAVLINQQAFTKTSNIWGVANNQAGTNTNRIVLFRK